MLIARIDPMADASLPDWRARSSPGTAIAAMMPYLDGVYANPSGAHRFARQARQAVDEARGKRVGGVMGRRHGGQPEQAHHHVLHLRLLRAPVAHHRHPVDPEQERSPDVVVGGPLAEPTPSNIP